MYIEGRLAEAPRFSGRRRGRGRRPEVDREARVGAVFAAGLGRLGHGARAPMVVLPTTGLRSVGRGSQWRNPQQNVERHPKK